MMKPKDVIEAENLIRRIRVIRSFLSDLEVRYVTATYQHHDFRKTEHIESLEGIINDAPSTPGYVWIDNPDGNNFALSIAALEKILANHVVLFREKYLFRQN